MKQTNNAIKFLMAQYRAIFQNAYFKGLATAAVVTMGLAAGQAQAADLENFDSITANQDISVAGNYDKVNISANTSTAEAFTLTIKSANNNKIAGGASADTTVTADKGTIIINGTDPDQTATKLEVAGISTGKATLSVKDLQVINGTLALTTATKASTVEADTITIGKVAEAPSTRATTGGLVTLASGSQLGTTLAEGDVGTLSIINLEQNGKIIALSGTTVSNTINAAKLNINGGQLIVEASGDGTKGAATTLNLALGSMSDGKITVMSGASLSLKFNAANITESGTSLTKQFNATGGEIALGDDLTVSGDGALVVDGAKVYATTAAKGVTIDGSASYKTSLASLKGLLDGGDTYAQGAKSGSVLVTDGTLAIVDEDEVDLTTLKFASDGNAAAGKIVTSSTKNKATLEINNAKIAGALNGADKLAVVANQLTLGGSDAAGVESLTVKKSLTFDNTDAPTYNLQSPVTLNNVDDSNKAVAGGQITGNVKLSEALTITGGEYSYSGDMTVGSAAKNLAVNAGSGVDKSSLVFNGKLLLDRTNAATLQASGTASTGEALLDLSDATIEFANYTHTSAITFLADGHFYKSKT